jgi:hypothetical protein
MFGGGRLVGRPGDRRRTPRIVASGEPPTEARQLFILEDEQY